MEVTKWKSDHQMDIDELFGLDGQEQDAVHEKKQDGVSAEEQSATPPNNAADAVARPDASNDDDAAAATTLTATVPPSASSAPSSSSSELTRHRDRILINGSSSSGSTVGHKRSRQHEARSNNPQTDNGALIDLTQSGSDSTTLDPSFKKGQTSTCLPTGPARTHPTPTPMTNKYTPLLSNRDILFTQPIMEGDDPNEVDPGHSLTPIFQNAPLSFTRDPVFATGSSVHFPLGAESTEELAQLMMRQDERDAMAAGITSANGSSNNDPSSQWPISMAGKSVAEVSVSNAVKSKELQRQRLEREAEETSAKETIPADQHVHGPGISDHSQPKARIDGYWEMRALKLKKQRGDATIYRALDVFKTEKQKTEEEQERTRREQKRRKIDEERSKPDDVPFSLAQKSNHDTERTSSTAARSTADSIASSTPQSASSSTSSSSSSSSSSPSLPVFAGVVCYLNGDTETRQFPASSSSSGHGHAPELSSYHLANIIKLNGGQVLPFPSRKQLTHIIADHLSLSKTRKEFAAMFRATGPGARARTLHIVRPAWVRACMQAGRRVGERPFSIVQNRSMQDIGSMFQKKEKQDQTTKG